MVVAEINTDIDFLPLRLQLYYQMFHPILFYGGCKLLTFDVLIPDEVK